MISLLRLIGNNTLIPKEFQVDLLSTQKFYFFSSAEITNPIPKKTSTLPPKIMEGKMDFANSRYLSNTAIFHFHDFGRKCKTMLSWDRRFSILRMSFSKALKLKCDVHLIRYQNSKKTPNIIVYIRIPYT